MKHFFLGSVCLLLLSGIGTLAAQDGSTTKPDPKGTKTTIFLRYKAAKKDENDKPIPVPIRASNGISLEKMSVNGNAVKLQDLRSAAGQIVKIGKAEYQVKKYLDNASLNKLGAPAVVIENLPPGKYTVAVTVTADFSGRVDEQSTGVIMFEVKSGEEYKPELENDLFMRHGK